MNSDDEADRGDVRPWIYLALVGCFFLQTWFVYFDGVHEETAMPLTVAGTRGLSLWRSNNCQACHQIHGFGGFLGPDLTNIVTRRPDEDWTDILTEGRKQMPAFGFDEDEVADVVAFLTDLSATGTGYPVAGGVRAEMDPKRLIAEFCEATGEVVDGAVLRGEGLIAVNGCTLCHKPFATGLKAAPDLTILMARTTAKKASRAILESKGSMPAYPFLSAHEVDEMILALEWMKDNRRRLGIYYADADYDLSWTAIPWFEYPNN